MAGFIVGRGCSVRTAVEQALQGLLPGGGKRLPDACEGEVWGEGAFFGLEVAALQFAVEDVVQALQGRAVQLGKRLIFDAHPDDAGRRAENTGCGQAVLEGWKVMSGG